MYWCCKPGPKKRSPSVVNKGIQGNEKAAAIGSSQNIYRMIGIIDLRKQTGSGMTKESEGLLIHSQRRPMEFEQNTSSSSLVGLHPQWAFQRSPPCELDLIKEIRFLKISKQMNQVEYHHPS